MSPATKRAGRLDKTRSYVTRVSPLLVLVLASGLALGEDGRLTARQIEELITGNTILGEWEGQPYAQYFDPNGTSNFHLQDGKSVARALASAQREMIREDGVNSWPESWSGMVLFGKQ